MITLTAIAVENELRIAERLRVNVLKEWPDLADCADDRVDILVGVRSPTDIDLLVLMDLAEPRLLKSMMRRNGTRPAERFVQHAVVTIEVKQLDGHRFRAVGNQIFPDYRGGGKSRSVSQQASSAAYSLKGLMNRAGFPEPYIHALAWLTEVDDETLRPIEPSVLGRSANWLAILDAAAQQNDSIYLLGRESAADGVRFLRRTLLARHAITSRDRIHAEQLSSDAAQRIVDRLAPEAGHAQIRIFGQGGTGKTTTLALLAKRLASGYGDRVLILTFHRTLRADIGHLIDMLVGDDAGVRAQIRVAPMMSFLLDALGALGGEVPNKDGALDYAAIPGALDETRQLLVGGPDDGDAQALREREPNRFAWDHILVDEAQDWRDAERDFLRTLYGHKRIVIADGLEQMALRQTRCNWAASIPKAERIDYELTVALRMMRNLALFANAVALQRPGGLENWRVQANDALPGGRIVVLTGEMHDVPAFLSSLAAAARAGNADPLDCLICVPPDRIENVDGRPRALIADAFARAGLPYWDASDNAVRDLVPENRDTWRIVPYDSCRGLEGWITVAWDLDAFYDRRKERPHLHSTDSDAPELVAGRWLMTVLTRSVHTLVVTLRDPKSELAGVFHDATEAMPKGVVEWLDANAAAARLSPQAMPHVRRS